MYIYKLKSKICTHTKHSETPKDPKRPQIKYPPNHKQGFVKTIIQNPPPPDIQNRFMWEEADEDGARGQARIRQPAQLSAGWVPLAHAKGRQETGAAVQSVAVSPHVKSPSDPAGSGVHSAAAPPGSSLSPWMGVTQAREKAEGRGPRPGVHERPLASSWLPDDRRRLPQAQAPATQQTPFACSPQGHGRPRGLGRNARSAEERPSRRPPPAPPPPRRRRRQRQRRSDTKPVLGLG